MSSLTHRLIKITDRTLHVVFSIFGWNSFTITLRQKPRGISRSRITRQREPVLRWLRETPLDFCFSVIVNKFHPNLEMTTSSVLSVILINLWGHLFKGKMKPKCGKICRWCPTFEHIWRIFKGYLKHI